MWTFALFGAKNDFKLMVCRTDKLGLSRAKKGEEGSIFAILCDNYKCNREH